MAGVSGVVERQAAAALRRAGSVVRGKPLVVAVSGGPDSVALLRALQRLSHDFGLSLHVAHLDHDFRGDEAVEDARFTAALAGELGLPCTVEKQDPEEYRKGRDISSFEQLAREMRYSFLSETARRVGASLAALGHTADDQAETVLLHVLRGSGLNGLRGMSEISPWPWPRGVDDVSLFRPLLGVTKADTAAYCRELGQPYREDSGNLLPRFTRNRVRRQLMPHLAAEYNPAVRESLRRLSRAAAQSVDFVESEVDRVWPSLAVARDGAVGLDPDGLAALHPALLSATLRRAYAAIAGDTRRLRESHIRAMLESIGGRGAAWSVQLPEGLALRREYGLVWMGRGDEFPPCPFPPLAGEHVLELPATVGEEMEIFAGGWRVRLMAAAGAQASRPPPSFRETGPGAFAGGATDWNRENRQWTERFSRAALGRRLTLRTRRPGDRFQPLGMAGDKKLQDFYTDAKLPRSWRDRAPLLASERGIAWVVGCRIAEWAKAGDGEVLWIRMSA